MAKNLSIVEFGNPILNKKAKKLSLKDIKSKPIKSLVENMRHTLLDGGVGIAIAAPQVGKSIALTVIAIRPKPHRPNIKPFDLVAFNPTIKTYGTKKQVWEGCLSAGESGLFAKTPRLNKVVMKYIDENGVDQSKQFSGLKAQVIQHEVDHLNGILFMQRVTDPSTYMSLKEYRQQITPS